METNNGSIYVTTILIGGLLGLAYILHRRNQRVNLIEAVEANDSISIRSYWGNVDSQKNSEQQTPLMVALKENNASLAMILLNKGASVQLLDKYGFTPLHIGCHNSVPNDVIESIIQKGGNIHAEDNNGWTALHMATSKDSLSIVKLLIEKKCDADLQTLHGQTCLLIAANNGFEDIVDYLLSIGADPTIRTKQHFESPLLLAAANNHSSIACKLINRSKDTINLASLDGSLPIHAAAARDNVEMLKILVENKADVNSKKRDGSSSLHLAVIQGRLAMVEFLLKNGVDMEAKDTYGTTALHRACSKKFPLVAAALIKSGANVNAVDNDKLTPLHSLCSSYLNDEKDDEKSSLDIFKTLLKSNANILATDCTKATPLHHAVCRKFNVRLVQELLEHGFEAVLSIDHSNRTPLHLVLQMYKSNTEIIDLITNAIKAKKPSFFDTFKIDERKEVTKLLVHSSLSEGEKLSVLEGDVTLEGIAKKINNGKIKNILLLTGAGLSTSAGIPDFRSPKGIYTNPELTKKLGTNPSGVFSLSGFAHDPKLFYEIIKEVFLPVLRGSIKPTIGHKFIALLGQKNLLLRNYTQNIDGLERAAGVPQDKLIESHGSFNTATCTNCRKKCTDSNWIWDCVNKGEIPKCKECESGSLKVDVVLFGESLPEIFFDKQQDDLKKCDLLIVIGTSLQVYPFAGLVNSISEDCPRLLFNQDAVGAFTVGAKQTFTNGKWSITQGSEGTYRDVAVLGDIDENIQKFMEMLDWKIDEK